MDLREFAHDVRIPAAVGVTLALLSFLIFGPFHHETHFRRPLTQATLAQMVAPTGLSIPGLPSRARLRDGVAVQQHRTVTTVVRLVGSAFADIDDDGDSDAAAFIQTEVHPVGADGHLAPSPASTAIPRHLSIVVVRAESTRLVALPPLPLGEGALPERLELSAAGAGKASGNARPAAARAVATFRTRSNVATSFDTRHQYVLAISRQALSVAERSSDAMGATAPGEPPQAAAPLGTANLPPALPAALGSNAGTGHIRGVLGLGSVRLFRITGTAQQSVTATLVSGDGQATLGLVGLDGTVVVDPETRPRSLTATLPAAQTYLLLVQSDSATGSAFEASVSVSPQAADSPPPGVIYSEKVLYLTFDDGPAPTFTPALLEVLGRYNATATFFMVGKNAEQHPDLVRQVRESGHVVANHSFTHTSFRGMTPEKFAWEVQHTFDTLGEPTARCVRPPYGALDSHTRPRAAEQNVHLALWDIDTLDWKQPGADAIADTIIAQARPGATVLMHDGGGDRSQTAAATERVLRELSAQGWRFASMC